METKIFIIDLIDLEATLMDAIYDANPNLSDAEVKEIATNVIHHAIDDNRLIER